MSFSAFSQCPTGISGGPSAAVVCSPSSSYSLSGGDATSTWTLLYNNVPVGTGSGATFSVPSITGNQSVSVEMVTPTCGQQTIGFNVKSANFLVISGTGCYDVEFTENNSSVTWSGPGTNWNDGGNSNVFYNICNSGSGTVTMTTADGCTKSQTVSYTGVDPQVSGPATVACGASVTFTGTQNGGTGTYSVSPGAAGSMSGATFTAAAGYTGTATINYSVDYTYSTPKSGVNNVTCATSTSINVTCGPVCNIAASATSTDATCGNSNGTASASTTGAAGSVTYSWSDGGSGASRTGLAPGAYTVIATDGGVLNCTASASVTISNSGTGSTQTESACNSYTWSVNGQTYTSSGTYTSGCNTLNLTINSGSTETESACNSYTWSVNGQTYTSTGIYTSGCNTLNLTINTGIVTTTTECDSYYWSANGQTYTTSGTYTSGCNTLNLTINSSTSNTSSATACDSYTWSVNGQTYTTGGQKTYNTTNAAGCSHVEILDLTINNSTSNSTSATACGSYFWSVNGTTYTTGGTYTSTSTNGAGCPHTETLVLTIYQSPSVTVTGTNVTTNGGNNGTAMANASNGSTPYTYLWSNTANTVSITGLTAGNYGVIVTDANGCTTNGGILITQLSPPTKACLGNYVWNDVINNGIQDASEIGVSGVTVNLLDATSNVILATLTTDAYGAYHFCDLNPGSYKVKFTLLANYVFSGLDLGGNDLLDSDPNPTTGVTGIYTLLAGGDNISVDAGIYLPTPIKATVGDRVWFDVDGNGTQDATEQGVSGITVTLYLAGVPVATTITDANGLYLFEDVTPATYTVGFTLPSGMIFTTSIGGVSITTNSDADPNTGKTNSFNVNAGDNIRFVDAGIIPPAATVCLGNCVWIDINNDGLQTAGEPAVPGITVKLYNSTNTVIATSSTDVNGNYLFCGLSTGSTYSVGFENLPAGFTFTGQVGTLADPSNSDANPATGKTVPVTLGATNNLTLDAGIISSTTAVVGNYVWYDTDEDGIQDANEAPISGVLVTLYDNSNNPVVSAVTDANGKYLFTNVTPGTYTVGFSGFPSSLVPTTKGTNPNADDDSNVDPLTIRTSSFTVIPGGSNLTLDAGFKANPIAGLGNYVWLDDNSNGLQDVSESGISGVVVTLYGPTGSDELGKAITNGDGAYSFPNLTAGSYRVGFSTPSGLITTNFNSDGSGINGASNSDLNPTTNKTEVVVLLPGTYNPNLDAGFRYISLPIILTDFKAAVNNCSVNLSWNTSSEINSSYFNVMRKSTAENEYKFVAKLIASGNSSTEKYYSYTDKNASTGTYSYVLQMVDADLKSKMSDEVYATVQCDLVNEITLYPNPANDKLNVTFTNSTTEQEVVISIVDMTGKVVLSKTVNPAGQNNVVLNVQALSNGSYILQISNLNQGKYSRKINIVK
jgi:hypothetical protein